MRSGYSTYYPGFETSGAHDALAAAFSPNGEVLYLTTADNTLLAVDSDGSSSSHVEKYSGGSGLRSVAVSPDGLSVSWGLAAFSTPPHIPASLFPTDACRGEVPRSVVICIDFELSVSPFRSYEPPLRPLEVVV